MKKFIFISAFAFAIGLAGCAVGPDYHRPGAITNQPLPKNFSDENSANTNQGSWKIAEPSANLPRGDWWGLFSDTELNRLETLALTNNQNLAAAAARFEQARDLVSVARS
jgi:multidrug efflux system outer membrane protein